jgi:hypothetical protein
MREFGIRIAPHVHLTSRPMSGDKPKFTFVVATTWWQRVVTWLLEPAW